MGAGRAVASLNTGHPGFVAHLIDWHRVYKKCGFPEHLPEFVGDFDASVAGWWIPATSLVAWS